MTHEERRARRLHPTAWTSADQPVPVPVPDRIVTFCRNCGAKNEIPTGVIPLRNVCGVCGVPFEEKP